MDINKKPIYPVETWNVTEKEFSMETNYRNETTFALSNGYIGTRGTFEEGYDFSVDEGLEGNFITDFMKCGHSLRRVELWISDQEPVTSESAGS